MPTLARASTKCPSARKHRFTERRAETPTSVELRCAYCRQWHHADRNVPRMDTETQAVKG